MQNDKVPTDEENVVRDEKRPTAIKDSGHRQEFVTGSRRDIPDGKGRYDLIPPHPIRMLARVFEDGAIKYGDRNWELGQPIGRYIDSAKRHLDCYWAGEVDEMHLHAALWNVIAAIDTEARVLAGDLPPSLDNHPHRNGVSPIALRSWRHVAFPKDAQRCWPDPDANKVVHLGWGLSSTPLYLVAQNYLGPAPSARHTVGHTCGDVNCLNPFHLQWVAPAADAEQDDVS